jgi:hypothetical protein
MLLRPIIAYLVVKSSIPEALDRMLKNNYVESSLLFARKTLRPQIFITQ